MTGRAVGQTLGGLLGQFAQLFLLLGRGERLATAAAAPAALLALAGGGCRRHRSG